MKVTLMEAPICKGSPTDGSQYAYQSLIEGGLAFHFSDVRLSPMTPPPSEGEGRYPCMKYLSEVMAVSRALYARVRDAILAGRLPVVIGGDHSVAIGSLAGASSVFGAEGLSVIYIDGHTDINTEKTTETGFLHGMPLAAAMGLCHEELTVGRKVNIRGKNTFILGARSIDPGEYTIIREQGVTLYTAEKIREQGMAAVMQEVLSQVTTPALHVSFDVDVLDEAVFPSTGYRMPNGLSLADVEIALRSCFSTGCVCSFDCVEYNPYLDTDGRDRETLFSLLDGIVS